MKTNLYMAQSPHGSLSNGSLLANRLGELFETVSFLSDAHLISGAVEPPVKHPITEPYEKARVYDALARIFGTVLEPCAGAVKLGGKLHISYNADKHTIFCNHEKHIEILKKNILDLPSAGDEKMLEILGRLISMQIKNNNPNFNRFAKEHVSEFTPIKTQYDNKVRPYFLQKGTSAPKAVDLERENTELRELGRLYTNLLTNLPEIFKDNLPLSSADLLILRPFQDLYKLKQVFNALNITTIEFDKFEGKKDLHAEIVLLLSQPASAEFFFGISKYSCFLCAKVLESKNIKHSGAHNMFTAQKDILEMRIDNHHELLKHCTESLIHYLRTTVSEHLNDISKNQEYFRDFECSERIDGVSKGSWPKKLVKSYEDYKNFYDNIWSDYITALNEYNPDEATAKTTSLSLVSMLPEQRTVGARYGINEDTRKKYKQYVSQESDLSEDDEVETKMLINGSAYLELKHQLTHSGSQPTTSSAPHGQHEESKSDNENLINYSLVQAQGASLVQLSGQALDANIATQERYCAESQVTSFVAATVTTVDQGPGQYSIDIESDVPMTGEGGD